MGGGGGGTTNTSQTSNQTYSIDPWLQQLSQQMGASGGSTVAPATQNAQNLMNQGSQMAAGSQGAYQSGLNTSQGASNLAGNSAVYNPNTMQQNFMNPYTQNVVQSNADIAQRNFNQQTAPSLMNEMGASGQYGSGRADQGLALAQSNMAGNLANTNAGLMNQGYQQQQNAYLGSMGIGVNAANVQNQAAGTQAGIGQGLFNAGTSGAALPGNVYNQYAAGTANLPHGGTGSSIGTGVQPAQNSGFF